MILINAENQDLLVKALQKQEGYNCKETLLKEVRKYAGVVGHFAFVETEKEDPIGHILFELQRIKIPKHMVPFENMQNLGHISTLWLVRDCHIQGLETEFLSKAIAIFRHYRRSGAWLCCDKSDLVTLSYFKEFKIASELQDEKSGRLRKVLVRTWKV